MKIPLSIFILAASLVAAGAQTFTIPWHTIDGGGGTSTGGVFTVRGTIGQPDAGGPHTNGIYSVTGGYWTLPVAVQTPGGPELSIERVNASQARISWTPATPGYVLQEATTLSPPNWANSPSGAANPVTVNSTLPLIKAYRLVKP